MADNWRNRPTKRSVIFALAWKYLERTGTQVMRFVLQIFLARLLMPKDFGLIVLIMVFINFAQVFVQRGFNTALIQNQDVTEVDFSSAFYLNMSVAGVLYLLLYFISPTLASFYRMPELVLVLRILSVLLFFGAVNSLQNAVIVRKFKFKQLFFSSIIAIIGSGIIGIYMAYKGYGIWALVWQQIANSILLCAIMWITVKWRPKLNFSLERVKILFSFGWKLLVSELLDTLYMDLHSLVIGKMFLPETLGYYNRGYSFPQVIVSNINDSIQSVMLPTYAMEQDNRQRLKRLVRRSVTMSSFIVFPLMAGLIGTATPIVKIVLTDKWLPCVPFLRICCLSFALRPIQTTNLQAINAIGRSDIFLKLEIIKKIYGLIILAIAVFCYGSVTAIALSAVLSGIISSFLNAHPNKKLIGYGYLEQIKDLMPSFLIATIMCVFVYLVQYLMFGIYVTLFLQLFIGVCVYSMLAWIFKIEAFGYLITTIIDLIKNRSATSDRC